MIRCYAIALVGLFMFSFTGCASRVLIYEKADEVLKNDEYDKKVQVKQVDPPAAPIVEEIPVTPKPDEIKKSGTKAEKPKKKEVPKVTKKGPRQPEIEDSVGFEGRRPIKDPFRVGEKVTLDISYFNIVAGTMDIMVKPMVEVNGQKAYHFEVHAETSSVFNRLVYAVNDTATTYVSYDEMIPLNLSITLKESKQLAEARTFVDWKTNKASYWQKRVTKEKGEESKKIDWQVLPYSQNVISAVYYLRTFNYREDKPLAFRVADEGKNIIFSGEFVRKERILTDIGEFDTVVMRPKISVDGAFSPVGDILFWLTDDDRRFIVRIESKIKIGTLVAKIKNIEKGNEAPP